MREDPPAVTGQDLAYERAVLSARADPRMARVVEEAFLHESPAAALEAFRSSEHGERPLRHLERLGIRPPARILDLGGGRGILSAALAEAGYRVTLCEPNPSYVCGTTAAHDIRDASAADFQIHNGAISDLDASQPFDAVVCRAVLHHIESLVDVLVEVRGHLRPGAPFLALDEPTVRRSEDVVRLRSEHPFVRFGVDERALRVEEYEDALRRAGFERVTSRFPVSLSAYRRRLRPDLDPARAVAGWLRWRISEAVRHPPGAVRTFVAHAPRKG